MEAVFNYDIPQDDEYYVHRIGRTGRAKRAGVSFSFVSCFSPLLAMGINVRLSIVGALAFGLCAYNFQILQVGHNSKMVAIALMPMVLAGVVYAYRKKAFLGAVLFGFALSFEIAANHPQITFYLGMIILAYVIAQLVSAIKNKTLPAFIKTSCFVLLATK